MRQRTLSDKRNLSTSLLLSCVNGLSLQVRGLLQTLSLVILPNQNVRRSEPNLQMTTFALHIGYTTMPAAAIMEVISDCGGEHGPVPLTKQMRTVETSLQTPSQEPLVRIFS